MSEGKKPVETGSSEGGVYLGSFVDEVRLDLSRGDCVHKTFLTST